MYRYFSGGLPAIKKKQLLEESVKHGDVLCINLAEKYCNLANKTAEALMFLVSNFDKLFSASSFILKLDSDTVLDVKYFLPFFETVQHSQNTIYGFAHKAVRPRRDRTHKWLV